MATIWDTLDDVPWGTLRQAHGTAERVPDALRALAAAGPDDAEDAYWRLDNVVVLQGSVYEAAYFAIPYAQAIVASDADPAARAAAYDLLVEIARGTSADPDAAVVEDGRERPLLDACVDRIASARPRYEDDLRGGAPLVRPKALDLLTSTRLIDDPDRLRELLETLDVTGDAELAEQVRDELADLD